MNKLSGKIGVVMGGHDGIGGAVAERFAQEGATMYVTSRRSCEGEAAHGEGTLRMRRLDASKVSEISAFFDAARKEAGRIHILVVSAGLADHSTLASTSEEHFDRTFGLNVRALVFATKAAAELMTEGGSIVLVGSIADEIGTEGYGSYGASKAAVRSFARTWANDGGMAQV